MNVVQCRYQVYTCMNLFIKERFLEVSSSSGVSSGKSEICDGVDDDFAINVHSGTLYV